LRDQLRLALTALEHEIGQVGTDETVLQRRRSVPAFAGLSCRPIHPPS
jgi:hypothetical protein